MSKGYVTIRMLATWLCVVVLSIASVSAQTTLRGDSLRLNAGPCVLTSTAGSPDTLVLTGDCSKIGTSAATNLTLAPTGDLVLAPVGVDVLPNLPYTVNMGSLSNKYLTFHGAELWVETLVAQNTIATIGGRVLIAPTNILTLDLAPAFTFITVKYNNFLNGDRIYMESDGKVEFMAVASSASGSGPYVYTVTRNMDGSGANQWYAGDAILNTGTTGNGFIDLYSTAGILSSGSGPSIVGNVRTGTAYNAYAPRWAIGNLNGLYGYGTSIYGTAFGDPSATNVTADATNGFRIRSGTTNKFVADTAGNLSIVGDLTVGTNGIIRSAGAASYSSGTGFFIAGGTTPVFRVGTPGASEIAWDGSTFIIRGSGGSATNMIRNSECRVGTEDWSETHTTATTPTIAFNLASWRLNDISSTCYLTEAGTPANATAWFFAITEGGTRFPVRAGSRYEASMYVGLHRVAHAFQTIAWYDSAGGILSTSSGSVCVPGDGAGGFYLSGYCRTGLVATAPTNAVTALPYLSVGHDGTGANPFAFAVRAFFGEATSTQTLLSEWGPAGMTEIIGGLIRTDTITAREIAALTITATEIAASTITGAKIAANTITAGNIAAATITATEIAASTITGAKIAATTITASNIVSSTITATQIAAATITASQIAANTITANEIAAGTITANEIAAATITATHISAGSITTDRIASSGGVVTFGNSIAVVSVQMTGLGSGVSSACIDTNGFIYRC